MAPEALNGIGGVTYDADRVVWTLRAPMAFVAAAHRSAA
ncbi:hypothetical protein MPLDJ20_260012 [Mesorhizobium plurifarium]|uniref:Uncharacterized protein n=1 Tax=Mesorhizobium plurifarium TaxID=69974 RepID=A0A090F6N7_MESPL|nr:hypothetical protein MPLDJ20_260012 [Mesorhizobium plurifarium]